MKIVTHFDGSVTDRLRAYAEQSEHLVRIPEDGVVREDIGPYSAPLEVNVLNPNVGHLAQRIFVTFSISLIGGKTYRHASFTLLSGTTTGLDVEVSESLRLKSTDLPAPSAVEAVCYGLGFTGRMMADWIVQGHGDNKIVVVQEQR